MLTQGLFKAFSLNSTVATSGRSREGYRIARRRILIGTARGKDRYLGQHLALEDGEEDFARITIVSFVAGRRSPECRNSPGRRRRIPERSAPAAEL